MAYSKTDIRRIRKLRYKDGLSRQKVAEIIGCSTNTVSKYAPGYPGKIDNNLLREAFISSGYSAYYVARRLGWEYGNGLADGSRVNQTLGLSPDVSSYNGNKGVRRMIDAETAVSIAEAIGVMPWEIGA